MDRLSVLPEPILITILSLLPLEEAVRTSVLASPWRNKWHSRNDVEINERRFLAPHNENENQDNEDAANEEQNRKRIRQNACINFGYAWIHSPQILPIISSFTLKFSDPSDYPLAMHYFTTVALGRNTKSLELDFSGFDWEDTFPIDDTYNERYDLSEMAYLYDSLESLKLVSCNLDYDNLATLGTSLKTVSLGWVGFKDATNLRNLLSNCPLLESLTLFKCFDFESYVIESQSLKTFVVDKCVDLANLSVVAHNLECFKYCGKVVTFAMFHFPNLEMVDLDFSLVEMFDEEHGEEIASLLSHFYNATTLTVCNYTTQVLPIARPRDRLTSSNSCRVTDLTIKTAFHESEYPGIALLLDKFPLLEKLHLNVTRRTPFVDDLIMEGYYIPGNFDWDATRPSSTGCLRNGELKVTEINGFQGEIDEMYVVNFLISHGIGVRKLVLKVAENNQQAEVFAGLLRDAILHQFSDRVDVIVSLP